MNSENVNMFDKLMELPLFQGASHEQISALVAKIPFHFLKFSDGQRIIAAGSASTHLRFIVSGKARSVTSGAAARVAVSQTLAAPNVVGADFMFGREPAYPFDLYAVGDCGILQLSKADYMSIVRSGDVFLFNILNYLSRNAQKPKLSLQHMSHGLVAERIAFIVSMLTTKASEDIAITFRQKDLCLMLGTRRTALVSALSSLKARGIVDYTSSSISVLDRSALVSMIHERTAED